jgi:RNA polymerase sigma factor (sigma-70 family)
MNDIRALFDELYEQHHDRLFAVVFKLSSRDEALSKDLVQDFFLKLWKQLESGRTAWECFKTWSNTVICNLWRDHCRLYETRHVSKHGDDFDEIRDARQCSGPESNQELEAVQIMEKAVRECTFKLGIHREILLLLPKLTTPFDAPETDAAIATELKKSPATIKTRRAGAIRALKKCLREKGINLTDLT